MCGIPYETQKPLDGISVKNTILTDNATWEDRYVF
jgi:hypothetical protein